MKGIAYFLLPLAAAGALAGVPACRSADTAATPKAESHGLFAFATSPRVPSGTMLTIRLLRTLSSESSQIGDPWDGVVTTNVLSDDRLAIPRGSMVTGRVIDVRPARRGERAMLHLAVRSVSVNGRPTLLEADSEPVIAGSPRARNLGAIAGGAAAGALIGRAGGDGGDDAAKGALVGGGVAAGAVAASKGYQVVLKEGTVIGFTLTESVAMR